MIVWNECYFLSFIKVSPSLNLLPYMFLFYIHTVSLCALIYHPGAHTVQYMLISSPNPFSLTYKQTAKPTHFIPLTQKQAQCVIKQWVAGAYEYFPREDLPFFFLLMDFHMWSGGEEEGEAWHPVIILTQICQQRSNLELFSFSKTNLDFRGRYALLSAAYSSSLHLHTLSRCTTKIWKKKSTFLYQKHWDIQNKTTETKRLVIRSVDLSFEWAAGPLAMWLQHSFRIRAKPDEWAERHTVFWLPHRKPTTENSANNDLHWNLSRCAGTMRLHSQHTATENTFCLFKMPAVTK